MRPVPLPGRPRLRRDSHDTTPCISWALRAFPGGRRRTTRSHPADQGVVLKGCPRDDHGCPLGPVAAQEGTPNVHRLRIVHLCWLFALYLGITACTRACAAVVVTLPFVLSSIDSVRVDHEHKVLQVLRTVDGRKQADEIRLSDDQLTALRVGGVIVSKDEIPLVPVESHKSVSVPVIVEYTIR